ncbi:DUF4174 domain-containing protein [Gemmobacter straminiformis]|uniref:DUF4174 domain-containing protein n=2 Tax=Paragemmobacter straminiformis TaxID=2045119 RepID=A0A842I5G8_9RHOB|nr:DUF4174 domain-containing protein [Gemmobacter straminiformis]MBC2834324.1 DUF4174 domain-containing protein [Gemmobacter straminiformis]
MKPLYVLVLTALLPLSSAAQEVAEFRSLPASDVVVADLMFAKRGVVVFADSANDPNFVRQMELIARDPKALAERDVVVITDTDPAAKTALRQKLRPRGFSLVLLDKDWQPELRKPLPWDVREISHAIDKFPLRRQEMNERPAAAGG